MLYFTKYAGKKFDILNQHKIFITKEEVEEATKLPDATEKKGKYLHCRKENLKVIIKKENGMNKIITFYPVK